MLQERNQNVLPVQYSAMQLQPTGASVTARVVPGSAGGGASFVSSRNESSSSSSSSRLLPLARTQPTPVNEKLREGMSLLQQQHDSRFGRASDTVDNYAARVTAAPPQVRVAHNPGGSDTTTRDAALEEPELVLGSGGGMMGESGSYSVPQPAGSESRGAEVADRISFASQQPAASDSSPPPRQSLVLIDERNHDGINVSDDDGSDDGSSMDVDGSAVHRFSQRRGSGGNNVAAAVVSHSPPLDAALPSVEGPTRQSLAFVDKTTTCQRQSAESGDGGGSHGVKQEEEELLDGVPLSETSTPRDGDEAGTLASSPFSPHKLLLSPGERRRQERATSASADDDVSAHVSALTPVNRSLEPPEEHRSSSSPHGGTQLPTKLALHRLDDDDRLDSPPTHIGSKQQQPSNGSLIMAEPQQPKASSSADVSPPSVGVGHNASPHDRAGSGGSTLATVSSAMSSLSQSRQKLIKEQEMRRDGVVVVSNHRLQQQEQQQLQQPSSSSSSEYWSRRYQPHDMGRADDNHPPPSQSRTVAPQQQQQQEDPLGRGGDVALRTAQVCGAAESDASRRLPMEQQYNRNGVSATDSGGSGEAMVASGRQLQHTMDMDMRRAIDWDLHARQRYDAAVDMERDALKREQELLKRQAAQDAREMSLNKQLLEQQAWATKLEQQQKAVDAAKKAVRSDLQVLASHTKRLHALTLQSRCAALAAGAGSGGTDVHSPHHTASSSQSTPSKRLALDDKAVVHLTAAAMDDATRRSAQQGTQPSGATTGGSSNDGEGVQRQDHHRCADSNPVPPPILPDGLMTTLPIAFTAVGFLMVMVGVLLAAWKN